jgi:hypothetical protein
MGRGLRGALASVTQLDNPSMAAAMDEK